MTVRVLLADDAVELRALLRLLLERSGQACVVGEAGDGEEAVRLAQALQPDVVLLDLSMPLMSGLDAVAWLSRGHAVVVLSGYASGDFAQACLDLGAACYLEKGGPASELVAAVLEAAQGTAAPGRRVEPGIAVNRAGS